MNNLSMSDKRRMFQIRNMMVDIPSNFSKLNENMKCVCNDLETMKHIYDCEILICETKPKIKYEKIYNGEIEEQIEVFRKFEENLEKREKLKNPPRDPSICDLLVSVENSLG